MSSSTAQAIRLAAPPGGPRRRLLACVSLVLAALAGVGCGPSEGARPDRIILVSMDTVRASEVDGYGGSSTPVLAEIASEGVLFANAYASSTFTIPSHASMFTGLHPLEHGVWNTETPLPESHPTLAERLRAAGYRTQGFHEGGYMSSRYGFGRGFDSYRRLGRRSVATDDLQEILDWMRAQGERPYFLFLHTYAAHNPYGGYSEYRDLHPELGLPTREELAADRPGGGDPALPAGRNEERLLYNQLCDSDAERLDGIPAILPLGFDEAPAAASHLDAVRWAYQRRIREIDRAVGRIRDELRSRGQWQDTLLVVTSDHGEAFFEHGLPWHGYVPFDEVLKIPLIVSYPRAIRANAGRVVTTVVSHQDLLPTLLGFARVPDPAPGGGVDLRSLIEAPGPGPARRSVFSVVQEVPFRPDLPAREVVIDGPYKLIEGSPRFGESPWLLFDLENDPDERRNLYDDRPELRARMLASLEAHRRQRGQPARDGDAPPPLSPDEEEGLRVLGYVE